MDNIPSYYINYHMDYPKIKYPFVVIFHCYPIFHSMKSSIPFNNHDKQHQVVGTDGPWKATNLNQTKNNGKSKKGGELATNPK